MSRYTQYPFVDPDGVQGVVLATSRFVGEEREKLIRLQDGRELVIPREYLQPRDDNSYRLSVPCSRFLQPEADATAATSVRTAESAVIPAIEEQIVVEQRPVETGRIRIHKHVEEADALVDEPLLQENWDIERVPVNRILTGEAPPEPRYDGETLVLPVLEEVLVVEKRLILREEMRVTRRRQEVRDPQTHRVRSEHVEVERVR